MLLREKVALVTGGGRGIGRAIALRFAAEGAAVVVSARTQTELDAVVEEIRRAGGRAAAAAGDVTSETACAAVAAAAEKTFGRVDILVNNAAITFPGDLDLPVKRHDLIFAVNTRAPLIAIQAVVPGMRARREGAIVNVSSLAALNYFPGLMAYGMSKIALEHMTVSLAAQLRTDGIAVNTFRIDVPVASEGFVHNSPGIDISDWEPCEVAAEGIVWMLSQPPGYTGNNVGMAALREEHGIMASMSPRPHRGGDGLNRVNPMPMPRS